MAQGELIRGGSLGVAEKQQRRDARKTSHMSALKRYNLALPEELFSEIQRVADMKRTTVVDLLRRFIKLGLIATNLGPNAELIIRENGKEQQIILI